MKPNELLAQIADRIEAFRLFIPFDDAETIAERDACVKELRALAASCGSGVADGWLMVPLEPIDEMIEGGCAENVGTEVWPDDFDSVAKRIRRKNMRAAWSAMVSRAPPPPAATPNFQDGAAQWMRVCFSESVWGDMQERGDRFLEETIELLQSHGYDRNRIATLVDYVYSRPKGEPFQEVGGVMVTLALYCHVAGLDMHAEGDRELGRITRPDVMEKIRVKQAAKDALHFDTPLPGSQQPNAQAGEEVKDA